MLSAFFQNAGFSGNELDAIVGAFQLKEFGKEEYFAEEGKTSRHLGFIESGMFQYFTLRDGEEKTTYISTENTFIASLLSYLNEEPSREYLRALSKSRVWIIQKKDVTELLSRIPAFKDFYLGLLEWQICCIEKSRFDLIMLSAEQRYEKMLRDEPHLLQQIPLQYLASILGVTPRHLSRIRKINR